MLPDSVLETTTSTGTGSIALAGAVTGFVTVGGRLSDGQRAVFLIEAVDANLNPTGAWEICEATYTASGNQLTSRTAIRSSDSNNLVNFAAGTKTVALVEDPRSVQLPTFTVSTLPILPSNYRAIAHCSDMVWSGGIGGLARWNGKRWLDPDGRLALSTQLNIAPNGATRAERYKAMLARYIAEASNIYYAAPSGSSGNSGTRASPWSLQHALNQLQPGDVLLLMDGLYTSANGYGAAAYQTLNSGTSSAYITVASENLHGARIHSTTASFGFYIQPGSNYYRVMGLEITGVIGVGIYCRGAGSEMLYNYIHDMNAVDGTDGGTGILIYDGGVGYNMNCLVEGNIIHDTANYDAYTWGSGPNPATRVHGIYFYGNGNIIRNNIIFRIIAQGITSWGSNQNNVVAYNTIWGCKYAGISLGAGDVTTPLCQNNVTVGNIVAHCYYGLDVVNATGANTWDRNVLYNNTFNITSRITPNGGHTNGITTDPQLIFPGYRGDFRPALTSPARRAGETTYLPALDFDLLPRVSPDLGAFAIREEVERDMGTGLISQRSHRFTLPVALPPGFPTSTTRPVISATGANAFTTLALTSGRAYWIPFRVERWIRCITLTAEVTTTGAGTQTLHLYKSDSLGRPTARLISGTFDGSTTGVKTVTLNQPLEPGVYWLVLHAGSTPTLRAVAVGGAVPLAHATGGTALVTHFYTSGVPSNPAPTSGFTAGTGSIPAIGIEYVL